MNNTDAQKTTQPFIKTISIIHLALIIGQVLFAVVAFAKMDSTNINFDKNDVFLFVAPIMAIGGFIASNIVFKQQLVRAKDKMVLKDKLVAYQSALITRFALLEGASLFNIVVFLKTGNLLYLIISGLIIFYFIIIRPTKDKVVEDLELSYQESIEL
ncbi:MAG: hypothetical protein JWR50_2981 [Mucilaginibacter sp.]|nr:hypothetical protein [Mucilaginibacter sp.]